MSERVSMNLGIDWKKAKTVVAGVDIGAVNSRVIILADGQLYVSSQVKTYVPKEAALRAMNAALDKTGLKLENIQHIVGTGCGKRQIPFPHKNVSEILCAAKGASHIWGPSVRTVLDIGGQSCIVVHVSENARVTSFLWNDKCAAGIGRSMESFAGLVNKELSEIGNIALKAEKFAQLSDFCPVYAQSEALDLVRSGVPLDKIIAGYHQAMATRIGTLAARAGIKKELAIIGGLTKNQGLVAALEKILKVNSLVAQPEWDPELAVALGAALYAAG